MLAAEKKKTGCLTNIVKAFGYEWLHFTKMANGKRNVYKIAGNYQGMYQTFELKTQDFKTGI